MSSVRFSTFGGRQSRRGTVWSAEVRWLLKAERELYQFGFCPRTPEKLYTHWHPDRSIWRRRREASGNLDGRKAGQRRDDSIAIFLKRCPNGKYQTFLMGIHQGIQLIFRHEIGHLDPDFIHSHPTIFIVRGIGAILITLSCGEEFFQCRLMVLAGSNDFR